MICPNCGAKLPDTVTMCYSCRMHFNTRNQQPPNMQFSRSPIASKRKYNMSSILFSTIMLILDILGMIFMILWDQTSGAVIFFLLALNSIYMLYRDLKRKAEFERNKLGTNRRK